MKLKLLAGVGAGVFVAASVADAASIAQWTFPSAATLTAASSVDPNATAGSLVKGLSTNALIFTNDYYASKPVMSISRLDDTSAEVFFQVTLTAKPGFELNMDSWSFDGAAGGGSAGQRTYDVKSSVEGLGFNTGTSLALGGFTTIRGTTGSTGPMQTISADLSSAAYDHLTSLTMRVYFSTPTTTQNIDVDNVSYNGGVFSLGQTIGTWNVASAGEWSAAGNWSGIVPNGIDNEANFLSAINATRTVFTDTPVTLGTMRFNNANMYHVTGGGSLTLQVSTGSALVQVQAGTHKINLPLIIASNTNLDVTGGATLKISDPVTVNAGKNLTPIGAGTVTYESTVTLLNAAAITFGNSSHLAALTMSPSSNALLTSGANKTVKVDALSMDSTARIDVKNNAMVVTGGDVGTFSAGSYTGISELVDRGRGASGQWDGNGIVTSETAATVTGITTIAVMKASDAALVNPSQFRGQAVTGDDVLVAYTYNGDANLSGNVDADDYFAIDSHYNKSGTAFGFDKGDFNYDGVVNGDDYMLIDSAFSGQGAAFSQGTAIGGGVTAVPEPTSAAVIGTCLVAGLLGRRRRMIFGLSRAGSGLQRAGCCPVS